MRAKLVLIGVATTLVGAAAGFVVATLLVQRDYEEERQQLIREKNLYRTRYERVGRAR